MNEATRRVLSPEAVEWLRGALAYSLQGVFLCGVIIAGLALFLSLRFPAGSPQELASRESVAAG